MSKESQKPVKLFKDQSENAVCADSVRFAKQEKANEFIKKTVFFINHYT